MSQCMRFPTMWYVRLAKALIRLHLCMSLCLSKCHIVGNHMPQLISLHSVFDSMCHTSVTEDASSLGDGFLKPLLCQHSC